MANTKYEQFVDRQKKYVESLSKKGDAAFQLIAVENFIQSMRKSGYKNTKVAVDEFIDNSAQAYATRIDIIISNLSKRKINDIAIIDNGLGMVPDMIRASVLWGGTDRLNDRDGFGRFGFGLPSAAISITKKYEVFSKVKGGQWHSVLVNIEDIILGKLNKEKGAIVDVAKKTELPKFVKEYLDENKIKIDQGTVIHLIEPDSLSSGLRSSEGFHRNMMEHIGLIYRNVIDSCDIIVNSEKVQPIDPLFLKPNCRYYDVGNGISAMDCGESTISFESVDGKKGNIRIRQSLLPAGFQRTGKSENPRMRIMKGNNQAAFIITRAGRQIDIIPKTEFPVDRDNKTILVYDRNWAIELDFDPTLDEEFGITVNKQQVTISERLWEKLAQTDLPQYIKGLYHKYTETITKQAIEEEKEEKLSEKIMKQAENEGLMPKPVDATEEKAKKAKAKVKDEAETLAKKLKKDPKQLELDLMKKYEERPYEIILQGSVGGDFFWAEQYGPKVNIYVNIKHKFYTDLYSLINDRRLKTAIEILLFVIGTAEIRSFGNKEIFYQIEKIEWSKLLNVLLSKIENYEAIDEKKEAEEERENLVKTN